MSRQRPVVITDAEHSQDEQLRARQIRYATMMGVRVVCLIIAGVLVSAQAPMLWLWLPLCIVGMVALPWMAVLIANDRPPKERHRLGAKLSGRSRRRSADHEQQPHDELSADRNPDTRAITAHKDRTIDAES